MKLFDVIFRREWCLPYTFYDLFPQLQVTFRLTVLPYMQNSDRIVWSLSWDGSLGFKDSYDFLRTRQGAKSWCRLILKGFVLPKFSMLV